MTKREFATARATQGSVALAFFGVMEGEWYGKKEGKEGGERGGERGVKVG